MRSLAFWSGDGFADNIEWALQGTPCKGVIDGQFSLFPNGLQGAFPEDLALVEEVRRGWPFLRDRRIDAYGDLLKRLRD